MTSKRSYTDLADYAAQQGAPESAFLAFNWRCVTHKNRPALEYPTLTGPRWRYLDGQEPRHDSPKGYKPSWYGLAEAIQMAATDALLLVNGGAGVIAAQYHGLPAFAVSDGEQRALPETMLKTLQTAWQGEIWIAQDCDASGRESAAKRARQLLDAGFIVRALDLRLDEHSDIADFCKVNSGNLLAKLADLPEIPPAVPSEPRKVAYDGDVNSKYEEWLRDEVLPAASAGLTGRKHSLCINPAHRESHASARIGKASRAGAPLGLMYYCTCGSHSLKTVAGWLGLDFKAWLKVKYPHPTRPDSKPKQSLRGKTTAARLPQQTDVTPVNYVSDMLNPAEIALHKTLLIAAPVGTGKTKVVADYANGLPAETMLTGLAQFRLLTTALAASLNDATHYEDASGQYQRVLGQEKRFITSVTSLPKFDRTGGVVVADEIEGCIQFILNSHTFKDSAARLTWKAFKQIVINSDKLIGMDAGLSDITTKLIQRWRGDVTVKRFCKVDKRGDVTLLTGPTTAIYQIGKLLAHGRGVVYVPCSSEGRATDIADYFSGQGYLVKKITRDTSNTADTLAFVRSAENRREYDLVVYTSAMGAGVSIDEPVYAAVGIFDSKPLAPDQGIQLFGRIRHAHRYYVACPSDSEGYETTNSSDLLGDRLRFEYLTSEKTGRAPDTEGDYLEMLQIWSEFEARRLKEIAQWRRYFIARLIENGYGVKVSDAHPPETFKAIWDSWKADRADSDWSFTFEDAASDPLANEDLDRLRMHGTEITREMKLRNIRFKIESRLGHNEVSDLDRDLSKHAGREKLGFLIATLRGIEAAIAIDHEQAEAGRPIQQREYWTLRLEALSEVLKLAGFAGRIDAQLVSFMDYFSQERSKSELEKRFSNLTSKSARRLFKRLGHAGTNAETITGLCRWLLDRIGIALESAKRGGRDSRQQFYWINSTERDYKLARARRAAEIRVQNIHLRERYVLDTIFKPPPHPLTESPQAPARPHPAPLIPLVRDYVAERRAAGLPINPFAKGAT